MSLLSTLPLRIGHSGVYRDNNKIYLFGGYIKNPDVSSSARPLIYCNDLIEINVTTQLWRNLTSIDQQEQQLIPCARNCHSAYLRNRDEMILFGGKSNGFHKDVWLYQFEHNLWTQLQTSGSDLISPRYGQSAVVFKDQLFVFGGYDNNSFASNELFKLNLTTFEWKVVEIESNSQQIAKRYHHASVLNQETGEWYIHGGKTANSIIRDTIKISLDSLVESVDRLVVNAEIIASNLSEQFARYGHSMVLEGNTLYSVGGCNQNQDFTDCTCLDLGNVSQGWKIDTTHSLSSIFNDSNKEEAQPVLHALVQIPSTDSSITYFVVGGLFQKTPDVLTVSPPTTTSITSSKKDGKSIIKSETSSFNIDLFNEKVNDDIFRTVLSFLGIQDLMKLHLVSKSLRICTLTTEDQYWEDFYFKKLSDFKEASKQTVGSYDYVLCKYVFDTTQSRIFDSYLRKKSNYKENLTQAVQAIMSKVEKKNIERTLKIEEVKQRKDGRQYCSKSELLNYSHVVEMLDKYPPPYGVFKVVAVGDGAVGKTTLLKRYSSGDYPNDYIPTVFDNHNISVKVEDKTYSIGLW